MVCNGTLPDCPILCTSGCPSSTYCSGTYCAAKKSNGVTCGGPTECVSNNCVDGVCCDTTCGGICEACVASKTDGPDGTCSGITVGTDPDGECSVAGSLNCAANNVCGP